jgi:thiamine-monophosphate kinase
VEDQVGEAMEGPRLAPGPEFDLIRRFLPPPQRRPDVRVGPGDDCAVVAGDGIALSTDMSVEGVHFRRDWLSPEEIGWHAAAAALSDLAAVAARPIGVLVSLAVAEADAGAFAEALMRGVREAAAATGAALLGGDLTRSPGPVVIDVTVVGEAPHPVLRSGARPGDELWVTGALGAAGLAVARLLAGEAPPPDARARFARPIPRTAEAVWLAARGLPRAMLDLSDGVAGDAAHLAAAGGVALLLDAAAIPVHPAVLRFLQNGDAALQLAAGGGEDYELLFAAAPSAVAPHVEGFRAEFGVPLTRVGRVAEGEGVWWDGGENPPRPVGRRGFQHFA